MLGVSISITSVQCQSAGEPFAETWVSLSLQVVLLLFALCYCNLAKIVLKMLKPSEVKTHCPLTYRRCDYNFVKPQIVLLLDEEV